MAVALFVHTYIARTLALLGALNSARRAPRLGGVPDITRPVGLPRPAHFDFFGVFPFEHGDAIAPEVILVPLNIVYHGSEDANHDRQY